MPAYLNEIPEPLRGNDANISALALNERVGANGGALTLVDISSGAVTGTVTLSSGAGGAGGAGAATAGGAGANGGLLTVTDIGATIGDILTATS